MIAETNSYRDEVKDCSQYILGFLLKSCEVIKAAVLGLGENSYVILKENFTAEDTVVSCFFNSYKFKEECFII